MKSSALPYSSSNEFPYDRFSWRKTDHSYLTQALSHWTSKIMDQRQRHRPNRVLLQPCGLRQEDDSCNPAISITTSRAWTLPTSHDHKLLRDVGMRSS
jgi:hypothetical protein